MKIRFILISISYIFITVNNPIYSEDNFIKKIFKKFSNKKDAPQKKKKKKKLLTIVGVDDKEILNSINDQLTVDLENSTPIERKFWIEYNTNELYKILYSYGYFDAKVEPFNSKTIKKFKITLNKRYKLIKITCTYDDYKEYISGLTIKQVFNLIGIKKNSYFSTKQVSSGIGNLKDYYKRKGFAFVNIEKPEIEIDSNNKTVEAIYHINLGYKTIINDTVINIQSKKNPKLLENFIRNRINWKKNDLYNTDTFNNFKEDLVKYDLFSAIDVQAKEPISNDNNNHTTKSDIIVDLKEAMLREISAGVTFNTTDWFGLIFTWKHHNIDGRGSNFSIKGSIDKKTPNLELKHNIYDILLPRQCLSTTLFGGIEKNTSYEETKFEVKSILWHKITRYFEIGLGGVFEKSKTLDKVPKNTKQGDYVNIYGIPIALRFDNTDSFLDPQKGIRFNLNFTPCFLDKSRYNVVLGKFSTYIGFKPKHELKNKFVLAIYSKYGAILNSNNVYIPRSKFFFSGGTDSIRGYGTKKIGPLDDDTKKPTGGTSIFEIGIEPRFRINNNMCITAFIEAGKVFDKKTNSGLFKNLMYGYGVGLIYYTPIAPIRVNLAFPTKRRKNNDGKYIDSFFQIYVSVGQAF